MKLLWQTLARPEMVWQNKRGPPKKKHMKSYEYHWITYNILLQSENRCSPSHVWDSLQHPLKRDTVKIQSRPAALGKPKERCPGPRRSKGCVSHGCRGMAWRGRRTGSFSTVPDFQSWKAMAWSAQWRHMATEDDAESHRLNLQKSYCSTYTESQSNQTRQASFNSCLAHRVHQDMKRKLHSCREMGLSDNFIDNFTRQELWPSSMFMHFQTHKSR